MQHSIAAKYAARPAARFVRASSRARERRLGLRTAATFRAAPARATVLRRPDARAAAPAPRELAIGRAARPRRTPVRPAPSRGVDALVRDRTARCARAARAPPRRRGAPEERDRNLRRRRRRPVRGRASRSSSPGGARTIQTWTLPEGHARSRVRRSSRPPCARSREETGLEVRIVEPARLDQLLVHPARHADPQDGPLLPDGADRRRPRPPRPRVRRGPLVRPGRRAAAS